MLGNLKGIAYRVRVVGTSMVNRGLEIMITIGLFAYIQATNIRRFLNFQKKSINSNKKIRRFSLSTCV